MTQQWQFLVVNTFYRDCKREVINFVSANYRLISSYILRKELDDYFSQLYEDGWELTRFQILNDGRDEVYYFRLPLVG